MKPTANGRHGSKWIRRVKRVAIYMRDAFCCVYCQRCVFEDGATLDHLVSRNAGGTNKHTNLVTACHACNSQRQGKPWRQFANPEAALRIQRLVRRKLPLILARSIISGDVAWDVARLHVQ